MFLKTKEKLFPAVPAELKKEFDKEVLYSNLVKARLFGLILVIFHAILLINDYLNYKNNLWQEFPGYYYMFFMHLLILLVIPLFLIFSLPALKKLKLFIIKPSHYFIEYFYILFILFWCTASSILDQFIHQEITVFIIGYLAVSVLFNQKLYQSIIFFLAVYIFFLIGLNSIPLTNVKLQEHIINSVIILVISWIVSRIFYNNSIKQFLDSKKLEAAIHEKENNEYNLMLINKNLDRIVQERTKALTVANEKLFNEITKRLQIEDTLKSSESKYRLLTDLSKDVIWTMDLNMKFTYISPSVEKLLGYSPEEFLDYAFEFSLTSESLQLFTKTFNQELIRIKNRQLSEADFSFIVELQYCTKNNKLIWGEVNTSAICDEDGRLVGIHGITRDISDRKIAEEALKSSEEKYRLITDNINDLVWCMDLNLNSTFTSPSIYKLLGITPEERKLISTKDILTPESYDNIVCVLNDTLEKIRNGIITDKNYDIKLEIEQIKKDGTVFWAESVVSVLYNKNDEIIGIQGVTRDISDRVHAEKTLRESEENFRILFENSPLGILVCNKQGNILRINSAYTAMLGFPSAEETEKINLLTYKPLIEAGISDLILQVISTNRETVAEKKYISKWGKSVYFLLHIKPINDDTGKLVNLQIIAQDISERKNIEQALRESEEMYRLVIETANDIIYTVSLDSIILTVNSSIEKNAGWKPEDVIGKSLLFFIHPDDVNRLKKNHFTFLEQPFAETSEFRFLHKNKDYLDVEFSTAPLFKNGKLIGRLGIGRNITERKEAERSLRDSEEKYRNLIENQGEGIGIVNIHEDFIFANPAAEEIFGVEYGKLVGRNLKDFVDTNQFNFILQQTKNRKKGVKSTYEITITRPDLEQREILLTVTPFYEKNKNEMSLFGIFRDITLRKKTEEALKKSEEKYRIIFENAKEGIFQTTYEGKYITVNPALVKMYGYDNSEELMKSRNNIAEQTYVDPELRKVFLKIMRDVGYVKGFEYEVYKKDGSKIWVYEDANAVKDTKGNILYFEGFVVDMTDKKKVEEAKKKEFDFIELSSQISSEFIKTDIQEISQAIIKALEFVVNHTQVCRGYVYLYYENNSNLQLQYEWNTKGTVPFKKSLSIIDTLHYNEFIYLLKKGKIIEGHTLKNNNDSKFKKLIRLMQTHGAVSFIQIPLFIRNKFIGYIGFDTTKNAVEWTADLINAYNLTGQLITHVLERKQNEEQIKASLNEKEILLKEIHHRVKNNLQVIISLLNLQANTISNEEIKEIFEESQDRIKAMAIIHEKLYQSKNFEEIDFAGYIKNLTDYLLHSYNIQGKNVSIQTDSENIPVDIDMAVPLGLIINELVTNAFKYAFKNKTQGKITVGLHNNGKDHLILEVADNGIGISPDINYRNTNSLGLQLVCSLTQQIEGTIELKNDNGTSFCITFPYKKKNYS